VFSIKSAFQELFKIIIIYPFYKPKKIIFDHIPKCAGSSFTAYLAKNYLKEKTYHIDGRNIERSIQIFTEMDTRKRHGFDFINGHHAGKIFKFASHDCLKVVIFREPIQRIISHYFFSKRRKDHYLHAQIHSKNISITEYVSENICGEVNNYYVNYFNELFKEDANNNIENVYRNVISNYNYIFLSEEFDISMKCISSELNLFHRYKGKRLKVATEKPRKNEIDPDVENMIASKNALDIQLYEKIKKKCQNSSFFLIKNLSPHPSM